MALLSCPECGNSVSDRAPTCPNCGLPVSEVVQSARIDDARDAAIQAPAEVHLNEHPVYRAAFLKFDVNSGRPIATWSWVALLFGLFWYLYRGMWAKAGIQFLVMTFTAGAATPLVWLYAALYGKYDYYLYAVQGKQLW